MYEKSGRTADPYRAACKCFAACDNRQHRRAFITRSNDCNALSEWLYFTAGDNRENNFRTEYEEE